MHGRGREEDRYVWRILNSPVDFIAVQSRLKSGRRRTSALGMRGGGAFDGIKFVCSVHVFAGFWPSFLAHV